MFLALLYLQRGNVLTQTMPWLSQGKWSPDLSNPWFLELLITWIKSHFPSLAKRQIFTLNFSYSFFWTKLCSPCSSLHADVSYFPTQKRDFSSWGNRRHLHAGCPWKFEKNWNSAVNNSILYSLYTACTLSSLYFELCKLYTHAFF